MFSIILLSLIGSYIYSIFHVSVSKIFFFCSFLLTATVLKVTWDIIYHWHLSPFRQLPSAPHRPVYRRFLKEPSVYELTEWINTIPNDGLIRYYGLFNREKLLVTTSAGVKNVFQSQAYKFLKIPYTINFAKRILGSGLVAAQADEHKVKLIDFLSRNERRGLTDPDQLQRKLLQPAFRFEYIKKLYPKFWTVALNLLDELGKDFAGSDTKLLDISDWAGRATMDVMVLTVFGGQANAILSPKSAYMTAWRSILGFDSSVVAYYAPLMFLSNSIWTRLPMKGRYIVDSSVELIRSAVRTMILAHQTQLTGTTGPNNSNRSGLDILASLSTSSIPLSQEQLVDHAVTFVAAGQETVSSAVIYTLMLLSQRPDIQDRVRAEIRSHIGSPSQDSAPGTSFDASVSESLTYLTAVCNESLRLYPPVPFMRRIVKSTDAELNGIILPNNTYVTTCPWSLNRSNAIWGPDAAEFKPERWLTTELDISNSIPVSSGTSTDPSSYRLDPTGGTNDVYAVISFSHGARSCIGERFAKAEMLALLAALVGRYEWKYRGCGPNADEDVKIFFTIVSRAVGGVWLEATRVDDW